MIGKTLDEMIVRTPLIRFRESEFSTPLPQTRIYLKPENLQPFGSYKIRGVAELVRKLGPDRLRQGLSAASAGNMGQAVAYAAKILEVRCRIYAPESAPAEKKNAIRQLGAELVELPYAEIWKFVQGTRESPESPESKGGGVFIHPAFSEDLLAGYGTIAREIVEDLPDVDAVVIPFGVGGLTLGLGRELRRLRPEISIYACEPETAAPLHRSLALGRASSFDRKPSFVDAIGTPEVLPRVFEEVSKLVRESVVVKLDEALAGIRFLLEKHKLVCEGAAAVGWVAARRICLLNRHRNIVCLLTGGNLPANLLQ